MTSITSLPAVAETTSPVVAAEPSVVNLDRTLVRSDLFLEAAPRGAATRPARLINVLRRIQKAVAKAHPRPPMGKNHSVFVPLVPAQQLAPASAARAVAAFFACFLRCFGVYIVNDMADHEADRRHPSKKLRPVAAGSVPMFAAIPAQLRSLSRQWRSRL
ncbi:hypothetical protein WG922_07025 [Ramlibacter sp. AN1015]|uniref:hypothetical protein n=1 Tax=Ramlibacter sp. AN1015 TaxID=3133428 RepID=UPI0030BC1746